MRILAPLALIAALLVVSGCGTIAKNIVSKEADAPAYFTEVTPGGLRYAHNYPDRPCFTIDLPGTAWEMVESTQEGVQWRRGEQVFRVYLTDNRTARFAVANMDIEQILRTFIAYELEYVKPWFEMQISHPPRVAEDYNGVWMQWGWEGRGGKRRAARVDQPADQRHVIQSLWVDPWVLSLDWATTDMNDEPYATPVTLDTLESLTFYADCFKTLGVGATWKDDYEKPNGKVESLGSGSARPAVRGR